MWLFSPISSFDCLIVCVEIDFRILKHSLSNLLFNSLFSFSFKPFNPYYPSVLPRKALWSLDLVKDYINKYWWPIWFLWPCDQPESSFQHITRKFLGGFCPRRWCSDARLQRISSVCETQQHQDFWNVLFITNGEGVFIWHRLVEDTSVTREPDNRQNQLLYYLNHSTIQRSPKVAARWRPCHAALSSSRLWRLPDRRSVPEERVWQSRDSRPQVLRRWQIHLRPQSSFKNQVRGRLCWFV